MSKRLPDPFAVKDHGAQHRDDAYVDFLRDVVEAANLGLSHIVRLTSEPQYGEAAGTSPGEEATVKVVQEIVDRVCDGPLIGAVLAVPDHPTTVLIMTDETNAKRITTTWVCGGFGTAWRRHWIEHPHAFDRILIYINKQFRGDEEALKKIVHNDVLPPEDEWV